MLSKFRTGVSASLINKVRLEKFNRLDRQDQEVMIKYIKEMRALRLILVGVTLFVIVLSRFAGDEIHYSGWEIVPSLIVPAIVPLLFFVILLDVLMTWVFRVDAVGEERSRLGRAFVISLSLVVLLTLSWIGYFLSLGE